MKRGLGKGLDSLIPEKTKRNVLPKSSPVISGTEGERVIQVAVADIDPNPHQPRKEFPDADLKDLSESIAEHGIIQPLIAIEEGNRYQLVAGERRLRAAKRIRMKTVPVIVREMKKQQQMEVALLENIQRQNLNPIEEAYAFKRLMDEFGMSQENLAKRIGKSRPVITNTLRLLTLPEEIQKALIEGKIPMSVARVIVGLEEKDQLKFFQRVLREGYSARDSENEAKKISVRKHKRRTHDPDVAMKEEKIQETLGTRATIKKSGNSGQIVIYFYSDEELREILRKICG